jgi:hypothetical protein
MSEREEWSSSWSKVRSCPQTAFFLPKWPRLISSLSLFSDAELWELQSSRVRLLYELKEAGKEVTRARAHRFFPSFFSFSGVLQSLDNPLAPRPSESGTSTPVQLDFADPQLGRFIATVGR